MDPDVASTGQAYVYTADDPVNSSDPSGLFFTGENGQTCGIKNGVSVCNSENIGIQNSDNADAQVAEFDQYEYNLKAHNAIVSKYLQSVSDLAGETTSFLHTETSTYASDSELVAQGGSGESYQEVFIYTDRGPLVNVPVYNSGIYTFIRGVGCVAIYSAGTAGTTGFGAAEFDPTPQFVVGATLAGAAGGAILGAFRCS